MADPNTIANIIDVSVTLSTGGGSSVQSFSDPVVVSQFEENGSFPTRLKPYVGTTSEKQAQLIADGFATNDAAYGQVTATSSQKGGPRTIYVGREDSADATWDATLTAIWAEADAQGYSLYGLCAYTRDAADVEAIADWVHARGFVLYGAQSKDTAVRDNTPGNVAANIRTKGYDSTWMLWHDPETASNYGPAVLTGLTGPFALGSGGTLQVQMDGGGTQTFTFSADAGTLLGSNTGTFAIADADDIVLVVDGGATQTATASLAAAVIASGNAETYNIVPGSTLLVRVDGGAVQTVTFEGTQAFDLGTGSEAFTITGGWELDVKVDGGATQTFTFAGTETTAQDVADLINATAVGMVASDESGSVQLTSNSYGTGSSIEVEATSTAGLLTELGLPDGTETGSGFAADLSVATAAEVATEIASDTSDLSAADSSGSVQLTSDTVGTSSRLQITGGTANSVLGFNTNEVSGSGDFADGSAVTTAEVVTFLAENLYGLVVANESNAVRLTSKTLGTDSSVSITSGTIATVLGLTGSDSGSGDFADSSVATAAEVAAKIAATLTGGTASDVSSAVVLTSATSGAASTVEVVGGTLESKLFETLSATGTGVQEDYADCAFMGRCITFDLDAENGQSTWTKQPLAGIFPDVLTATQKTTLHEAQKVNTYTTELGRNETGFGTVLFGTNTATFRYIDERVSADWLDARMTEALNDALNKLADNKAKGPYGAPGIQILTGEWKRVLSRAARNGHTFLDLSSIQNESDNGITIPTASAQTSTDIALRKVSGFQARQQLQGAIHRVGATINLTVAQPS